jgi:hypothetical protein
MRSWPPRPRYSARSPAARAGRPRLPALSRRAARSGSWPSRAAGARAAGSPACPIALSPRRPAQMRAQLAWATERAISDARAPPAPPASAAA